MLKARSSVVHCIQIKAFRATPITNKKRSENI